MSRGIFSFPLTEGRAIVDGIPDDRRIVLLGESTHGTEEFYTLRAEATKRLILERGFTAVVFEADFPLMEAANEYVQGRRAEPFPDGRARFPSWMWRNKCMVDFLDWAKRLPPAQVPQLFGMDCYSLFESKRAVVAFLEKHDPEFASEVRARLSIFDKFETGAAYADAMLHGPLSRVSGHIVDTLAKIQARLQWGAAKWACSDVERFSAEQNLEVVIAADEYYRKAQSEPRGSQASWNARDQHMTTTLLRIQHRLGDPRVVVWAHNSHVGDASASSRGGAGFERNETWNLGQMARATLGAPRVWVTGFYTHRGVVTAAPNWGEAHADVPLLPALPDSYEGALHALCAGAGCAAQGLAFNTAPGAFAPGAHGVAPGVVALLDGPRRTQRWVGVSYKPDTELQSHYGELSLRGCYDQIVYVDCTSALAPVPPRPLPRGDGGGAFASRASTQRLVKEWQRLQRAPPPGIHARPLESNLLEWHFVVRFDAGVYAGGEYHGRLDFPQDYPMAPPAFRVLTPSGRFEPAARLCLSMSDYHPESWNPGWTVETMLIGLQSFMNEESDAIGSIRASAEERRRLAAASRAFNAGNPIFVELFGGAAGSGGSGGGSGGGGGGSGAAADAPSASVCRFCFSSEGVLIAPCMCKGSNEFLHLECLRAWQRQVVLSQPTHPKYTTNIDEVCGVCCEPFVGEGVPKASRHAQIVEFVGGAEVAALIAPGNLLVTTREASRENLEIAAAHPEVAARLATWTRAVFLMLRVDAGERGGGLVAVSTSAPLGGPPPDARLPPAEAARWAALGGAPRVRHWDGGPLGRGEPIAVAHAPALPPARRAALGVRAAPPAWVFGPFDRVAAAVKEAGMGTVNVVWGYGGWGATQVLAEIGRGGWGLVHADAFAAQRPDATLEPDWALDFEWARVVAIARLPPESAYTQRGKRAR
jgi:erythromycin esterase-like protein/ubiquitin-protein ligase